MTAIGIDKNYDRNTSAMVTLSSSGVLTQDLSDVRFNAASAFWDKNVGVGKAVAVVNISASGSQSGNYQVSSPSATTRATITAKNIVVDASGSNKVYDGSTGDTVILSSTGVIKGDTVKFASSSAVFADKNVADNITVTVSGIKLTGTDAGNYAFNASAFSSANITPKGITVTATGTSMVYNATLNSPVTLSSSGAIKADTLTFPNTTALMADKNV